MAEVTIGSALLFIYAGVYDEWGVLVLWMYFYRPSLISRASVIPRLKSDKTGKRG